MPKYNENGSIDLIYNHPELGEIPYTASPDDSEPLSVDLFQRCLAGEFGAITPYAPATSAIEAARVERLWQAAHNYEYAQISGSAIGLLAMGVMSGKPKCIAVQAWIRSIWTEYYTRKASGSTNYDYSFAGAIPYSVPEIMTEMGV